MRVSSNTYYDLGILGIQRQQTELLKNQQQIATGKKYLSPSDNPPATVRALELTESIAISDQHKANSVDATNALKQEDTVLQSVSKLITEVRSIAIAASGNNLTTTDKAAYATTLRLRYQELLALANQQDGNGQYLFSGFSTSTLPYNQTSGAGTYQGDTGLRKVQISPSRQIDINDPGSAIFKTAAGNDLFKTIDNLANLLSGLPTVPGTFTAQQALTETDAELTNVLVVHGSVGVRLKEIATVQSANTQIKLHYQTTLSNLQDIDYAAAISELNQRQTNLEAALQSFQKTSGMSLFNYF